MRFQTINYRGIRPTDPNGRMGLRNPERGFRVETEIAYELEGESFHRSNFHLRNRIIPHYEDYHWLLDARRYEPHGLTLVQTYCYLDRYIGKAISDGKFALIRKSFDCLRKNGLKAVLRFAYERDVDAVRGPVLDDILRHIEQLKGIVRENSDVIFVMQAGFVGAWGEWGGSRHKIEGDHKALAGIVAKIFEILPPDIMLQVRVPKYKTRLLSQSEKIPADRIGLHNDGFLARYLEKNCDGGTWLEHPIYANPGNPEFDCWTKASAFFPVDGELFWGYGGGKIDGFKAAVRMRLHHYSSFSIAHSYSEREGKYFSIDDWIRKPVSLKQVLAQKLPRSDGYFEDSAGREVKRTQFEYIRDHLGYRLELRKARFPARMKSDEDFIFDAEIINRGFSAIHKPRDLILVLIGNNRIMEFPVRNDDVRRWQPFEPGDAQYKPLVHKIEASLKTTGKIKKGAYMVGLWLPDIHNRIKPDARYAIKFANRDVPWWTDNDGKYGVNILGITEIE